MIYLLPSHDKILFLLFFLVDLYWSIIAKKEGNNM